MEGLEKDELKAKLMNPTLWVVNYDSDGLVCGQKLFSMEVRVGGLFLGFNV